MFSQSFLKDRKTALLKKVSECTDGLEAARVSIRETTSVLREPTSDTAIKSAAENCSATAISSILENGKIASYLMTALKHLNDNDGQYGICVDCENELSEKRLIAIPWAQRCVKCQEEFEARVREAELRKRGEESFNSVLIAAVFDEP